MKLTKVFSSTKRTVVTFHDTYVEISTVDIGRTYSERARYDILNTTKEKLYQDYLQLGFISEHEVRSKQ
jgi:hypothetical protein